MLTSRSTATAPSIRAASQQLAQSCLKLQRTIATKSAGRSRLTTNACRIHQIRISSSFPVQNSSSIPISLQSKRYLQTGSSGSITRGPEITSETTARTPGEFAANVEVHGGYSFERELRRLRERSDGSIEDIAKWARETFGDAAVPDGVLSHEEAKVYNRLFGEAPSILTKTDEVDVGSTRTQMEKLEDVVEVLQRTENGTWETIVTKSGEEGTISAEENVTRDDVIDIIEEEDDYYSTEEHNLYDEEEDGDIVREDQTWATDPSYLRTHPYTLATRFSPASSSTVFFPKSTFIDPVTQMLSETPKESLRQMAESTFGGAGLPYSPNTPLRGRSMEQRHIPLMSKQSRMKDGEAELFLSAVMPQTYAAATSALSEVRKRLGSEWLKEIFQNEEAAGSGPFILDAGAGGAGILAWRDIVKAEFGPDIKRMGKATVVVGSDTLRRRAARLLDNTSFIPRLPDRVPAVQPSNHAPRKQYDIIIASHQIWPIKTEAERKSMIESLWSLLNPNGGVLIFIEKGIPRGFEAVADAREHIRTRLMVNPAEDLVEEELDTPEARKEKKRKEREQAKFGNVVTMPKDPGMIIAPCTNHKRCPMYPVTGTARGRRDWCHFSQRYVRPAFLQSLLGGKSRNHDDVKFSYLAVRRGIDPRTGLDKKQASVDAREPKEFQQDESATQKALFGYGGEKKMLKGDYTRNKLEREIDQIKHQLRAMDEQPKAQTQKAIQSPTMPYEEGLPEEEQLAFPAKEVSAQGREKLQAVLKELENQYSILLLQDHMPANSPTQPKPEDWNDLTTPFTLPRMVLPPIKRKRHVIFDACTAAGTIERWFVSKKCGKAAYRDARHSRWGDLWALGAYSRTPRKPKVGEVGIGAMLASRSVDPEELDVGYDLDGQKEEFD